jgi:hypothetical protein
MEVLASGFARALRDQAVVDAQLPAETHAVKAEGVRGWLYPVRSRLGDAFQLFLWFDGSAYQVKVLEPATEEERPHACHLFPGGRICLGEEAGGGAPTLEAAYARSVVWANGYSVYRREGEFPF